MKKAILLISIILFCITSYAQDSQEKKNKFDKGVDEIDCRRFKKHIDLDKTITYDSPNNKQYDLPLKSEKYSSKLENDISIKVDGAVNIKNTYTRRKNEDIFIDANISVFDSNNKSINQIVVEWHKGDTEKGEEYKWNFNRTVTLPSKGYLLIEVVCKRVLSVDVIGSSNSYWEGKFDLINGSKITLSNEDN